MKNNIVCNIKVFNKKSRTAWDHRRVPINHVETLKMSPNLEVEVVRKFHSFSYGIGGASDNVKDGS